MVAALSLFYASQIELNSPLLADLSPEHEARQTNAFIEERLGGIVPLDVLIPPPPGQPRSAAYGTKRVRDIRQLTQALAAMPDVLDASSPVDLLDHFKPILENVGEREADALLPTALLLADDELSPWVSDQEDMMRISLRIKNFDTHEAFALFGRIRKAYESVLKEPATDRLSGQGYLNQMVNAQMVDYFSESFVVGLILIFTVMVLTMGSVKIALLGLIPNLMPLVLVAGIMGWAGIELRYTTALVLTVAFGLAVDDTIHFIAQLAQERRNPEPIRTTLEKAGPGIVISSMVLAAGFLVLLGSEFLPNRTFGTLIGVTAAAAVLADLVLLPACLHCTKGLWPTELRK